MRPPAKGKVGSCVLPTWTSADVVTVAVSVLQLLARLGSGVVAELAHASLVSVPVVPEETVPVTVTTTVWPTARSPRGQLMTPADCVQLGGVWAVTPPGTESVTVTDRVTEGPWLVVVMV